MAIQGHIWQQAIENSPNVTITHGNFAQPPLISFELPSIAYQMQQV